MQVQHKSKKKNQTAERPSVLGIGKTFRSWFGLTILWIKLKFNNTKNNFILKRKFEDVLLAQTKSENENTYFVFWKS
jgi:chromosome segregation and condensation protein ScpB